MNTPVEQRKDNRGGKPGVPNGKFGTTSFTKAAVQRAMDAKAAAWGAPAGYYTVEDRAGVISRTQQVWRVRVRLFGGSVHHIEDIVFGKEGGYRHGNVRYEYSYDSHLRKGGKRIELFKLTERYPSSSLEAAVKWSAEGK